MASPLHAISDWWGANNPIRSFIPVTDFAEPPLQAEIIIKSSITESLILPQISMFKGLDAGSHTSRCRSG